MAGKPGGGWGELPPPEGPLVAGVIGLATLVLGSVRGGILGDFARDLGLLSVLLGAILFILALARRRWGE